MPCGTAQTYCSMDALLYYSRASARKKNWCKRNNLGYNRDICFAKITWKHNKNDKALEQIIRRTKIQLFLRQEVQTITTLFSLGRTATCTGQSDHD